MDHVISDSDLSMRDFLQRHKPVRWSIFGWMNPRTREIFYVDVQRESTYRGAAAYPTTDPSDPQFQTVYRMRAGGVEPVFVPFTFEYTEGEARHTAAQYMKALRNRGHRLDNKIDIFGAVSPDVEHILDTLTRTKLIKAAELDVVLGIR